jgi:NitT/TauT family transport system ATP-binding protein
VAPTRGVVRIRGTEVREPFPDVGIVFQSAVLLPWRTVLDNVMFSIEMLGLRRDSYRDRAMSLIELAGLAGFERKYPWELSGGMQQRVAICRALVHDPSLLLMDEPFGALDAMTREEMGLELLRLWEERRKTILFVTHSIREAVYLSDRVLRRRKLPYTVLVSCLFALWAVLALTAGGLPLWGTALLFVALKSLNIEFS